MDTKQQSPIARNLAYNVAGLGVPVVLAVVATPFLIRGLGIAQFGLLSLLWAFLGYFSFLDLGVGRALTNTVAKARGKNTLPEAWNAVRTSVILVVTLFTPLGGLVFYFSERVSMLMLRAPEEMRQISIFCIAAIGLALPVIVLTGVVKGALEGFERFDVINRVRLPMSLWTYGGPLFILVFTTSLLHIVVFLLVGRVLTLILFWAALERERQDQKGLATREAAKELLSTGGWISIGATLSPILIFVDRFVIGAKVALGQIAYYTAPMDAISKVLLPVDAVAAVYFPALSRTWATSEKEFSELCRTQAQLTFLLLLPCCLGLICFGPEIIEIWISASFSKSAAPVLQILTIGVFSNGIARVPAVALQASGRARVTALSQLFQAPIFFIALAQAVQYLGINGAACVWTARVALDGMLLSYILRNSFVSKIMFIGTMSLAAVTCIAASVSLEYRAVLFVVIFIAAALLLFRSMGVRNGVDLKNYLRSIRGLRDARVLRK